VVQAVRNEGTEGSSSKEHAKGRPLEVQAVRNIPRERKIQALKNMPRERKVQAVRNISRERPFEVQAVRNIPRERPFEVQVVKDEGIPFQKKHSHDLTLYFTFSIQLEYSGTASRTRLGLLPL